VLALRIDSQLELKAVSIEDTDELFQLIDTNRAHLDVWFPWVETTRKPADTRAFVQSVIDARARDEACTAVIRENGRAVGLVGVNPIDLQHNSGDLGYWLIKGAEGRGIMTRSATALVSHCFDAHELNRITLRAAVQNGPSRAVAKRLGFSEEGVLREVERSPSGYVDLVFYSMLRREYLERLPG